MIQALRVARGSIHALRTHRHEWTAIKPMLSNQPRGVPRANDRRVLNGIFWISALRRALARSTGCLCLYTTCYNRFIRWRGAGVWSRIIARSEEPRQSPTTLLILRSIALAM